MDAKRLRRACEVARLPVEIFARAEPQGWYAWGIPIDEARQHWAYPVEGQGLDWIESRCASLLVAKVRERDQLGALYMRLCNGLDALNLVNAQAAAGATDEQRIAAALEVLE